MSSDIFDTIDLPEQQMQTSGDIFDSVEFEDAPQQQQKPGILGQVGSALGVGALSVIPGATRQVARAASRVGETALGLPGDIKGIADMAVDYIGSKVGLPTGDEIARRQKERTGRGPMLDLPTSSRLNEFMNSSFGGYLAPQNGGEQFVDDVVSDATALMLGRKVPASGGAISKAVKMAKPLFTSIGANIAKEATGALGGGVKSQTAAKIGTMFLTDLIGRPSVKSLSKELYRDAAAKLPEGATVEAGALERNLTGLEKRLAKGGSTPSKTPVQTKISEIRSKIKDGKISVDELQEFKRDVNEISSSLYDLPKDVKAKLRSNVNELRSGIKSTIKDYGKENPAFLETWNEAEEVHSAIQQSSKARSAISKAIKDNKKFSLATLGALGVTAPKTIALGIPGAVGLMGSEFVSKIMKSPTIRKHYKSVINSALKEESASLAKNLTALDRSMKKEGFDEEFDFEDGEGS